MESLCVPRDQPEKEREGEGERERVDTGGRPSLCKKHNFIFKSCLYTLSFTQWKIQSHAGAAVLTLSVYLFVYKRPQVIYIIFWPRGLLTLYGSLP